MQHSFSRTYMFRFFFRLRQSTELLDALHANNHQYCSVHRIGGGVKFLFSFEGALPSKCILAHFDVKNKLGLCFMKHVMVFRRCCVTPFYS